MARLLGAYPFGPLMSMELEDFGPLGAKLLLAADDHFS